MPQNHSVANAKTLRFALYSTLIRIRPAQLGDLAKRALRVRRVCLLASTGQTFFVDPVSIFGIHLLRDGVHEPGMTRLLQQLLGAGDNFIDVGGNEGYFSVIAATLVGSGSVHC